MTKSAVWLISLTLVAQTPDDTAKAQATARLRALLDAGQQGILHRTELAVQAPSEGWELGMISWVDVDRKGNIYLLQRGEKADPVVVIDRQGHVLRSWGKGLYKIPHSIRIDSAGNVWTTDAESSTVLKFTPAGKRLMQIEVGEQPTGRRSRFVGTTDVAFGPHGRLFITDGYGNARVLEYTPDGKRVRQWGTAGGGPGQFRLPHGITIDRENIIYIADRENGRVQKFDLDGKYLGEWPLGRTYSVRERWGDLGVDATDRYTSSIAGLDREVGPEDRQGDGIGGIEWSALGDSHESRRDSDGCHGPEHSAVVPVTDAGHGCLKIPRRVILS
jgi:hypothetical protein